MTDQAISPDRTLPEYSTHRRPSDHAAKGVAFAAPAGGPLGPATTQIASDSNRRSSRAAKAPAGASTLNTQGRCDFLQRSTIGTEVLSSPRDRNTSAIR